MNARRLPSTASRGVLSGQASLGLPTFEAAAYLPAPSPGPACQQAQPVDIAVPEGWDQDAVNEIDVDFAVDDSGSMYWHGGDPRGVRRAASLSVVRLIARSRRARVGVVHWGSEAPAHLVLPLTPVRHRRQIEAGLALPPSLGGNNFPAALARSREVLQASGPTRIKVIIAITDGIEELDAAAAHQLALLPSRSVHVVLVDHSHGCTPDLEAGWLALPLGSFTRLDLLDTRQMANQIAQIVATATAPRPCP